VKYEMNQTTGKITPRHGKRRASRSAAPRGSAFDFAAHLQRQRDWSARTFGPGSRAMGVVDHIRKELREIEADPPRTLRSGSTW